MKTDREMFEAWYNKNSKMFAQAYRDRKQEKFINPNYTAEFLDDEMYLFKQGAMSVYPMIEKLVKALDDCSLYAGNVDARHGCYLINKRAQKALAEFREAMK